MWTTYTKIMCLCLALCAKDPGMIHALVRLALFKTKDVAYIFKVQKCRL